MQIDEKELERRLNSSKNLANTLSNPIVEKVKVIPIEKDKHSSPLSENEQILAGTLAFQMPVKDVARELNITPSQVSYAKNTTNPKVKGPIQATIGRVQELALDKMMQALGLMSEEKFTNASLKDLSIVAANMAKIVEKTTQSDAVASVQLIIYAPEMKRESSYKVIDV